MPFRDIHLSLREHRGPRAWSKNAKRGFSVHFVIVVGVNRLQLGCAQRREGGGGKRFGGVAGFPGFVFPMQGDRSQNADDVHVEVHRPRKERRELCH